MSVTLWIGFESSPRASPVQSRFCLHHLRAVAVEEVQGVVVEAGVATGLRRKKGCRAGVLAIIAAVMTTKVEVVAAVPGVRTSLQMVRATTPSSQVISLAIVRVRRLLSKEEGKKLRRH